MITFSISVCLACDQCGSLAPLSGGLPEALPIGRLKYQAIKRVVLAVAREAHGWSEVYTDADPDHHRDYCPDCFKRLHSESFK